MLGRDGEITNSYNIVVGSESEKLLTKSLLESKDFYINTLGWDETIWNFDDLDIENSKYPTLRCFE